MAEVENVQCSMSVQKSPTKHCKWSMFLCRFCGHSSFEQIFLRRLRCCFLAFFATIPSWSKIKLTLLSSTDYFHRCCSLLFIPIEVFLFIFFFFLQNECHLVKWDVHARSSFLYKSFLSSVCFCVSSKYLWCVFNEPKQNKSEKINLNYIRLIMKSKLRVNCLCDEVKQALLWQKRTTLWKHTD